MKYSFPYILLCGAEIFFVSVDKGLEKCYNILNSAFAQKNVIKVRKNERNQ